MAFSDDRTESIPVELEDGTKFKVEAVAQGREDVAFGTKSFQELGQSIEGVVRAIAGPIKKAKPSKATVKFGLEVQIEQGSMVAAIVRGQGKSNLEITLEWESKASEKVEKKDAENR